MKTLLANLQNAAWQGSGHTIGGGRFTAAEIGRAVDQMKRLITYTEELVEYAAGATLDEDPLPPCARRAKAILETLK